MGLEDCIDLEENRTLWVLLDKTKVPITNSFATYLAGVSHE